ncbi:MAG: hypothetical protein WBC04_03055 [Candidatus Acidiferrales bacterium]
MVFIFALPTWAQDSSSQSGSQSGPAAQPVPPVPAQNSGKPAGNSDANPVPAVVTPSAENVSLSGAQSPSLEPGSRRSFLFPQIEIYSQVDSNAANTAGSGGNNITSITSILGGLTLQKLSPHSQFNLNYLGGRSFSNAGDQFSSTTHTFGAAERWLRARWSGVFTDQLSYMSESLLGGANSPDLGGSAAITNLSPTFLGGQSLFTSRGPRLLNTSVVEVDYQSSPRSSYTLVGSYDFLHFFGPGLVDSGTTQAQVGYNYALSHRDTISVLYRFGAIRFQGSSQSIHDHTAQLAYGHRIAQRLALRLAGGPEATLTQSPTLGSTTYVSWSVDSSLQYQLARTSLELSYDHGVTAGSGLFLGSTTDQVSAVASRQLSRMWSVSFEGGYARNRNNLTSSLTAPANATVDSVFGSVQLIRAIGRNANFFVNYWPRYQTSNTAVCPGTSCGTSLVGHQVAVGFEWHPNPISLE